MAKKVEQSDFDKATNVIGKGFADNMKDDKKTGEEPAGGEGTDNDDDDLDDLFPPGHPMYREPADDNDDEEQEEEDDDDDDKQEPANKAGGKKGGKKTNKDDPSRFEYWQSQATKLEEMNRKLIEKLSEPSAGSNNGNTGTPAPDPIATVEAEIKAIVIPAKPTKPAGYDEVEAFSDPDSASFKYRQKLSEWQDERFEAVEKRDELRQKLFDLKVKNVEEPVKRMANETRLNKEQQKIVATVQKDYKLTEAQAIEFVEDMSKPESVSMDNLVALYKLKKGVVSPASKDKPSGGNRFKKPVNAAPPIPNGSGASNDGDDDDLEETKAFNRGLLSFR